MARTALKVLIIDAIVLLAEFLAIQDVQARSECALGTSLYGQECLVRSSPSYTYSLFTQSFSMATKGYTLQSPPTLDWIQLLTAVLFVVNIWFAYTYLKRRRPQKTEVTG